MTWFKNLRELLGIQKNEMCLCMVVSEQEGAEIWIDGKKTNYLTPKLVALPKGTEVKITVKLIGHKDHTAFVRSSHNLTYYHCNLERIPLRLIHNEVYKSAAL
ncbi:MAG: PEGA domain-containing protein [Bdellovibrio sp.]|nr:PEGA domain-containing protein [Bdellovibrio sp.]